MTDEETIESLIIEWDALKEDETIATNNRRKVEDKIKDLLKKPVDFEGTHTEVVENYKLSVTYKNSQKIDDNLVQEIAAQEGTAEYLSILFKWKPTIDKKAWKAAPAEVTTPLLDAIETKPSRPTFKVTKILK